MGAFRADGLHFAGRIEENDLAILDALDLDLLLIAEGEGEGRDALELVFFGCHGSKTFSEMPDWNLRAISGLQLAGGEYKSLEAMHGGREEEEEQGAGGRLCLASGG
jgi:hypothetical protein